MSPRLLQILSWVGATFFWLLLVFLHILHTVYARAESVVLPALYVYLHTFALCGFLATTAAIVRSAFDKIEWFDVLRFLWRLFGIGMVGISVIIFLILLDRFGEQKFNLWGKYVAPVLYSISVLTSIVFFWCVVFVFRRFVLYQKNRLKVVMWGLFRALIIISILGLVVRNLWEQNLWAIVLYFGLFLILNAVMSFNISWAAYLNFNQKLKALGMFALIALLIGVYGALEMRMNYLFGYPNDYVSHRPFLYLLGLFGGIYCAFAMLTLFFNLPSASVFDARSSEIASVSKINQAIQSNLDFSEILNSLLNATMMIADGRAGWIELCTENGEIASPIKMRQGISEKEILELIPEHSISKLVLKDRKHLLIGNMEKHRSLILNSPKFNSLLCVPIFANRQNFGTLIILKEYDNSFEETSVQSLLSLAEQAGSALENATLIRNSIEVERYHEQLKIAQEVQHKLLPKALPQGEGLELYVTNENAEEVGGDFYDVLKQNERWQIALGDVSGKGTQAAFYMAEMKGIFHALAQLPLSTTEFITYTNQALAACLQKGLFITLSYLQIDTQARRLSMIRAGHCPALYYSKKSDSLTFLREGTLGLGIVRDNSFANFIKKTETLNFEAGDMLILYTDGIVEAKNTQQEEYGYQRLLDSIHLCKESSAEEIGQCIVSEMKRFTAKTALDDDYTVFVIRFRE